MEQKCQIKNSVLSDGAIKCGVRLGSILGRLFFFLIANKLSLNIGKKEFILIGSKLIITGTAMFKGFCQPRNASVW